MVDPSCCSWAMVRQRASWQRRHGSAQLLTPGQPGSTETGKDKDSRFTQKVTLQVRLPLLTAHLALKLLIGWLTLWWSQYSHDQIKPLSDRDQDLSRDTWAMGWTFHIQILNQSFPTKCVEGFHLLCHGQRLSLKLQVLLCFCGLGTFVCLRQALAI